MDANSIDLEHFADQLQRELEGEVRFDAYSRGLYSTDASIYQIKPVGVVIPRNLDDVQRAIQIAAEHGVPILPRGSGTSLSGQTVGTALVIDFSKYLNRILEIDPERCLARVEPGVVLDQLNAAARQHGLQFGPDVATSDRANLGGMIGNNSAGARSILHGKTVDHVRCLNVILADGTRAEFKPVDDDSLAQKKFSGRREGEVYRCVERIVAENAEEILARYPKVLRRVSGYNLDAFVPECRVNRTSPPSVAALDAEFPDRNQFNLSKLIVGAEGTLATVTEAVVHLVLLPPCRGLAVLHFKTLDHALEALDCVLACQPSAVEIIDRMILDLAAKSLHYGRHLDFVVGKPEALLFVEFSGTTETEVAENVSRLESHSGISNGLTDVLRVLDPVQRDRIWSFRKAAVPLLLGIPGARKPIAFVEDTAVDPARLPEFVVRFREVLKRHGTTGSFYGHASVGCLHIRPLLDPKNAADVDRLAQISRDVCELVVEFGGSMSGEHGDGLSRSKWNERLFGTKLYQAFREVKRAFDPQGLMNPGKVVDGPEPTEDLRSTAPAATPPIETFLDFSREGGLAAAAELCNGSGVCRKLTSGTMCPSFMATREEEHTTRGRANALRLALSGALPQKELTSKRMYDVFDLCLMCKGCKAECPSNVDVAKLKVEFLAHYYEEHPLPVGARFMGHVAWINRIGSATAPLSNWLMNLPGSAWMGEMVGGIDRRRRLPQFASRNFAGWFDRHTPDPQAGSRGRVVLLDDCLTSFTEPGMNIAATRLLERAGYRVERAGLWCCGRPLISKGLLAEARELALRNLAQLQQWVEAGVPILGCEPSCLLTLVDEYLDLVPGPSAKRLAEASHLVDAWLADRYAAGELKLSPRPLRETALLHGHCQQKALVGSEPTHRALKMIPELQVQEVDSGCCGMAGSFGYEKGHYEISMAIGDRVLFPAVEAHTTGPLIAPGFSCRHQVEHATGRVPLHPVELLWRQVSEENQRG